MKTNGVAITNYGVSLAHGDAVTDPDKDKAEAHNGVGVDDVMVNP